MFDGFGGGGSAFDVPQKEEGNAFSGLFGEDKKEDGGTLTSKYSVNNDSKDNENSSPFGFSSSNDNSPFDSDDEPPFSSNPFDKVGSSDPHSNDNGTSSLADLNAREANYGNLSVVDKMRGMQSNRLNMDGEITLAEQYSDKSLDRRFGDGRHNVTMTDIYTDEHLYKAVRGLNTDGFIDDQAENAYIDIEGSGSMNLNDYNKKEDFDPFGGQQVVNAFSEGLDEMQDLGIIGKNKANPMMGDMEATSMVHNQDNETNGMPDYSKESNLGKGGIEITVTNDSSRPNDVALGLGKAVAEVVGGVALMASNNKENNSEVEFKNQPTSNAPDINNNQPNMKSGQPNMRAGGPDMKAGGPDMRAGGPDMNSGTPSMRPDMDSGYTAGKSLPANLKNIKKAEFYRLIKFDGKGNPIGPDGKPLILTPGEKAALLKLKKKFEEEDSEPVVKKVKIDPLVEAQEADAQRRKVLEEMENGEEGDLDTTSNEPEFDISGVAGAGAIMSMGDNNHDNNDRRNNKKKHNGQIEFDQRIDPNSIFDETEVMEARELGISLKELRDYRQGKIEKPLKIMSMSEVQTKLKSLKEKLDETDNPKEIDFINTDIENLENEMLKKLNDLL